MVFIRHCYTFRLSISAVIMWGTGSQKRLKKGRILSFKQWVLSYKIIIIIIIPKTIINEIILIYWLNVLNILVAR